MLHSDALEKGLDLSGPENAPLGASSGPLRNALPERAPESLGEQAGLTLSPAGANGPVGAGGHARRARVLGPCPVGLYKLLSGPVNGVSGAIRVSDHTDYAGDDERGDDDVEGYEHASS